MKAVTIKALTLDALYQVLDNSVFRILAVLVLFPILMTFVFGFREEGIVVLFGLKTWEYEGILRTFGLQSVPDPGALIIESILEITFSFLAGSVGVLFCISATAFFVPRMIEKGAADVLFHKPVSRLGFFLSRYFAGLVFVALLSCVLVVGMYLGLLLVSGHNDIGILFAALTLTYLFGLIHAVSMLIGVVTRSTVAAILLTILFFFGNGCVQGIWAITQQTLAKQASQEEPVDPPGRVARAFFAVLDGYHYVFPKTGDADIIAQKLRRATTGPVYDDDQTGFEIDALPGTLSEIDPHAAREVPLPAEVAELLGERLFAARSDPPGRRLELWRRAKRSLETPSSDGKKTSRRMERSRQAVDDLEAALVESWGLEDLQRDSVPRDGDDDAPAGGPRLNVSNERLTGSLPAAETGGRRELQAIVFGSGSWYFTLLYEAPAGSGAQEFAQVVSASAFVYQQPDWYADQMDWDAQPKYNLCVSIGSSLAFTLVMLLLGWWRLDRIDF